jgi:uncharacterized protein YndB with AHSA1/START domain
MSSEPIIIERIFNAPAEKVWQALTDKNQMKEWYFDLAEFKPEVGFEFTFTGGKDGRSYLHLCEITELVSRKRLQHTWKYDGYDGNTFVTWDLSEEGDKTKVKLTHEGLETLPPNPDFAKENFIAGWNDIVGTHLKNFVEKN